MGLDMGSIPTIELMGPALLDKALGNLDLGSVLPPSPKIDPIPVFGLARHILGTGTTRLLGARAAEEFTGL